MNSFAIGMKSNTSIIKLILSENSGIRENLNKLCDALIENRQDCKLIEIDLSKCSITSECARPIVKLLNSKYKLRHLNLRDNSIRDDTASEMLGGLVNNNSFITRLNLEYNPIKH